MGKIKVNKGIGLSFISLLLLGIMPIISNSKPTGINALQFTLYLSIWQLIFATPIFLGELQFNSRGIFSANLTRNTKKNTILTIFITGAMFSLSTFLYVFSLEKAGTVSASIAIQAYPLFAILLELIFLNKRKSLAELLFTIFLVIGLYYLGTNGTWKINNLSIWILVALCVPMIWSAAHLLVKGVLDNTPITPAQVTFIRVLVSSILIIIVSISTSGLDQVFELMNNRTFQYFALAMGLVYYLELINWFYAVRHVDVSVASSITTPWPVVTTLLAAVFLHERIETYQLIALAFICICVYGILFAGKKKRESKT